MTWIVLPSVAPRRLGKASKPVSIFARDPLCRDTCRYCRRRPCDVGIEHDDHTCYDCEQQLLILHPEGVPGAPWQLPLLPGCESWCQRCTSQRCAVREPHDLHICMRCEDRPAALPTRGGMGTCHGRFASIWRMALCACVCVCRVCVFVVFCSTG